MYVNINHSVRIRLSDNAEGCYLSHISLRTAAQYPLEIKKTNEQFFNQTMHHHAQPLMGSPHKTSSLNLNLEPNTNPIKLILMEMGKSRNSSIAISRVKIAIKTVHYITRIIAAIRAVLAMIVTGKNKQMCYFPGLEYSPPLFVQFSRSISQEKEDIFC